MSASSATVRKPEPAANGDMGYALVFWQIAAHIEEGGLLDQARGLIEGHIGNFTRISGGTIRVGGLVQSEPFNSDCVTAILLVCRTSLMRSNVRASGVGLRQQMLFEDAVYIDFVNGELVALDSGNPCREGYI